ncbi:hypothetical protein KP509_1Z271500 [Ceratopteris richardii]|nr:hypothetical protein KP509_1Z271500 [Ceratopteris richardii]
MWMKAQMNANLVERIRRFFRKQLLMKLNMVSRTVLGEQRDSVSSWHQN